MMSRIIHAGGDNPLVSIIIPTYNRRNLVKESIESCLLQTYRNIEVIVVDDGSTDGTLESLHELLSGAWAGRVVFHQKPNGGTSSAKNCGLTIARGEYVQYLDSDDVLRPEKVARQVAASTALKGRADCCLCFGRLGPATAGWHKARQIGERWQHPAEYISRLCERTVHVISNPAPLWRKEFCTRTPGWGEDLSVAEEWEYYIRLLCLGPSLAFVDEDLFWARSHEGEQLSKAGRNPKHCLSYCHAARKVADLLRNTPFWTERVRVGLLLRGRTAYVNLLRHASKESVQDFEHWFLTMAQSVPSRSATAAVYLRRAVGRTAFLALFDVLSGVRHLNRRAAS